MEEMLDTVISEAGPLFMFPFSHGKEYKWLLISVHRVQKKWNLGGCIYYSWPSSTSWPRLLSIPLLGWPESWWNGQNLWGIWESCSGRLACYTESWEKFPIRGHSSCKRDQISTGYDFDVEGVEGRMTYLTLRTEIWQLQKYHWHQKIKVSFLGTGAMG